LAHSHFPTQRWLPRLDRFAIVLSAICAVHCALTPLLLLGLPLIASHDFERGMRLVLAVLGLVAVGIGTTLHRSWRAAVLLALGLIVFVGLEWSGVHGPVELALSFIAASLLVGAHVFNTLACRTRERRAGTDTHGVAVAAANSEAAGPRLDAGHSNAGHSNAGHLNAGHSNATRSTVPGA
jgi:hypothetical protein